MPDLLEELRQLEEESRRNGATGAPGFSMEDVAKQKGITTHYAQTLIARLIDAGKLRYSGKQRRANRVGGWKVVPVYLPA